MNNANAATPLQAWIDGIGLLAPGLDGWERSAPILGGCAAYVAAPTHLPTPELLPPAERRRASRMVKLALGIGLEAVASAGADPATLASVFASSSGDGRNCDALCDALASEDRLVSPTRFTNSVHNVAAGFWSIATGAMSACQVICAHDASFAAGLIEAAMQAVCAQAPVLLLAYDVEYGGALHGVRPLPDAAGIALLLSPVRTALSRASLALALAETSSTPATLLSDDALENLRVAIPVLRGLPLLQALAAVAPGEAQRVRLDYLSPMQLEAVVTPC